MTTRSPTLTKEETSTAPLRGLLRRPALCLVLAALAAGLLSVGAASPATAAETCPNAMLREQNNSTELPECRAYEMVSSPYKQGFDLQPQTFSDGGIVSYDSTGNFAGSADGGLANQYLGVRTSEGWETRSLDPPLSVFGLTPAQTAPAFATGMRSSVVPSILRSDPPGYGESFYVRDFNGNFTRVGQGPTPQGPAPGAPPPYPGYLGVSFASDDLSHLVFGGWEYTGAGAGAVLSQVNVENNGATVPGESCPDGISADGRVVVFSTGCRQGGIPDAGVWARIGEATTVAVSGSQCTRGALDPGGLCNGVSPGKYVGSAADGSRVFFSTAQQLVNSDTDSTPDLYECDIPPGTPAPIGTANPCASLTEVSGAASGANVERVVAVSEDGSRVYFVAQGAVLAGNPGANDETAVAGNHNLYLWTKDAAHPAGTTTFVAAIDENGITGAQTTPDGRYLVFLTTSSLASSGPGADTDGRADMYRYDAESETLQRISTSVTGSGGNDPGFDVIPRGLGSGRVDTISADGSMVVFQTAEPLSPQDTDGVRDVYLWHDGHVSLISHRGGESPWIDASGQNIYFFTNQPLTAADRDVNADIYDARIDGGFDLSRPAPCSGEACQGQPSTPLASAGSPGSETLQGAAGGSQQSVVVEAPKSKPLTRQQKLVKALKLCRKKPKHKRVACERQARKRYAPPSRSARRSHR